MIEGNVQFPDLSQYDVVGFDTETTGVDHRARPVGLSISTPDEKSWYFSWGAGDPNGRRGPPEMNNCSLPDVVAWANKELTRPGVRRVGHYALFDLRMLAYFGITVKGAECTQTIATLTDENRPTFSLDNIARSKNLGTKADNALHDWMVRHLPQQKLKPTRKSCAPHYWRVPYEVMREYAEFDPVLTLRVDRALYPDLRTEGVEAVYRLECALLPILIKMHLTGVRVDRARAAEIKAQIAEKAVGLKERWVELCRGEGVNYRSADELQPVLDRLGIAYPLTPKTKKPSITKSWLEALDHPLGEVVRSLRQLDYYAGTSIDNYILGNLEDGEDVIHGEFHPLRGDEYGTVSGRFSSGGALNLQNIPARDETWAPLLRSLFVPMHPNQWWLKIDYSQIEYRLFAHYAGVFARLKGGTSAMEEAYVADPRVDFHDWVTKTVWGLDPADSQFKAKRKRGKNVNFCRLYGGGINKIALTAGCTYDEAAEFVAEYDEKIPEAALLLKDISDAAARRGHVRTFYGRKCRFLTEGQLASRYGTQPRGAPGRYARTYKALNSVLQGSAADLMKLAMIEVDKEIDWDSTLLHLTVHDELDFSVPKGEAAFKVRDRLVEIMQDIGHTPMWNGLSMRVPIIAEADLATSWGGVPIKEKQCLYGNDPGGRALGSGEREEEKRIKTRRNV